MGFSSTFVTDMGNSEVLPEWLVEKWKDSVHFRDGNKFPLSSKTFATVHKYWFFLEQDIQKAFAAEKASSPSVFMVYLHECGGVTRVEINKEYIQYHDPISWRKASSGNTDHDFGDNCLTDIANAQDEPAY